MLRLLLPSVLLALLPAWATAQVVEFQLTATDLNGAPRTEVRVDEPFLLSVTTQHVGGYDAPEHAGVFAAYIDVTFDAAKAHVEGPVQHGALYQHGTSGDVLPGLLDNVGGFSSSPGGIFPGAQPIGIERVHVLSVPFRATQAGELSFQGRESGVYPQYDVLVYGKNVAVPAREIEFGAADLRIAFGALRLPVLAVPEPAAAHLVLLALGPLLVMARGSHRPRGRRRNQRRQLGA